MELTLEQALQKGIEAHQSGRAEEADRYYTAILKVDAKHADANHNMGVLAVGVGKASEALPFFEIALEANPKIAQFWLSYIDTLLKLDRMSDAKAAFERAKGNGIEGGGLDKLEERLGLSDSKNSNVQDPPPDQQQVLINLYTQGQYQEALEEATRLLNQFPNSFMLYNIIGASNQGLGKLEEAVGAYTKALSIKPDFADAYYNMGNALEEQGKLDEAIEAYDKAISLKPDYVQAYYNKGNTLKDHGKLEEALEAYTKVLLFKPDFAQAYSNKGNVLQEQGKLDEAIEAYDKAISLKPDYADAYNNMGNALKDSGKLEEAIEAYTEAISIKPDYVQAYYNKGNALKDNGKLEEAIEAYTEAISIKPDYAEACNNMGIALKEQGKLEEALEAYTKSISINSDYAEPYDNMGLALQEQGKLEEAIEAYTKAVSIKPDYAAAYLNMGNTLKDQGKLEEALEAYNKALSIKPEYVEAYNNTTEALKVYSPQKNISHALFITDQRIKRLSSRLINSKSNEEIIRTLSEGFDYLKEDNYQYKTPLSQIYKRNVIDLNCGRHMQVFDTRGIIPEFCFGCFKVQVEVSTFIDLIKLTNLFYRLDLKDDLTRKTMIEARSNISGYYKGFIYCRGLDQAHAVKSLLDVALKKIFSDNTISKIKRGCSEFPLEHPEYGKIVSEPEKMMRFPEEWKATEEEFDQEKLIKPRHHRNSSLPKYCLSDFYIIQKWIDYAKGLNDHSIIAFKDNPIIFREVYKLAKSRVIS